jgi:hypothetical protein
MSSYKNLIDNITESPVESAILIIALLIVLAGYYFVKNAPMMQNFRDKMDDYKQKMILSLIVKNNEIHNTNSWSFSNVALYLLESYDMV